MNTENEVMAPDTFEVELDSAWGEDEGGFDAPETPETEQETEDTTEVENVAPEAEKVENTANQPERFTLKNKVLGETKEVTLEEMQAMAQKGWDYDRVQQERDQLRQYKKDAEPAYAAIKEYAKRAGFGEDISKFLDALREQELRANGKTEAEAKNIVEQEKREASLVEREQAVAEKEKAQTSAAEAERQAQEARNKDIQAFFRVYPNVDPKTIPTEVWEAVSKGDTLTNAYTMHENKRLMAELAAERQNKKNKASAPGSLSANAVSEQDELDRIWAEDD